MSVSKKKSPLCNSFFSLLSSSSCLIVRSFLSRYAQWARRLARPPATSASTPSLKAASISSPTHLKMLPRQCYNRTDLLLEPVVIFVGIIIAFCCVCATTRSVRPQSWNQHLRKLQPCTEKLKSDMAKHCFFICVRTYPTFLSGRRENLMTHVVLIRHARSDQPKLDLSASAIHGPHLPTWWQGIARPCRPTTRSNATPSWHNRSLQTHPLTPMGHDSFASTESRHAHGHADGLFLTLPLLTCE